MIEEYIASRRAEQFPGFDREDLGAFVRYTPTDPSAAGGGFVGWSQLAEEDLDKAICEQVSYFEGKCSEFEWKVYEFDRPAGLREKLLEHGFVQGPEEAFMTLDVAAYPFSQREREGVELRRIETAEAIAELVSVQEAVWQRSFPWLADHLMASLESRTIVGAYLDGKLVGKGWIDYVEGSPFADIHGGAVLPEYRGQGLYSLVFEERVWEANQRGIDYIVVDSAPMSRPILEKKGFDFICWTWPLVYSYEKNE